MPLHEVMDGARVPCLYTGTAGAVCKCYTLAIRVPAQGAVLEQRAQQVHRADGHLLRCLGPQVQFTREACVVCR